ncbi:MAG: response regulator [Sulfurimonas sp.]|nr:response regulator [Sulfurimonas sp.]
MEKLRLLIADDDEDNRLVLRATCRNLECFEIKDAVDGLEAVEIAESWHPHIILMDIMMPRMDGFEASKIIKERYPQTVIIAVTGVLDSRVEDKMSLVGVDIYINKPIDRELIRFKLQSIASSFRLKLGGFKDRNKKIILNPFNSDIPSYKTIFDIVDAEAMMEFGMWLFDRYNGKVTAVSSKFDKVIELFYKLMSKGGKMTIIVEESYEELYITMKFEEAIVLEQKILGMLSEFGTEVIVQENILCARLSKPIEREIAAQDLLQQMQIKRTSAENIKIQHTNESVKEVKVIESKERVKEVKVIEPKESIKEVRVIESKERELLHQSFIRKTSAADYVDEIGDILDEILELSSIDEEWREGLNLIEKDPSEKNFIDFVDSVLNIYVRVINNLFEFTALAYALTSLGVFIKDSAKILSKDSSKTKTMIMLFEHLGEDLTSWREHIFVLQDTADIHYLDSSFFSSCMQIEGIISNKEVSADDEDCMEFF